MEMTEVFDSLKQLQVILVEKYNLEKQIDDAPKQLVNLEELVKSLKKKYIENNSEYEEVKALVNSLSLELDEAVKSRENGEKMMDNITTHREYEALEKQISEASEKEKTLRASLKDEQEKLTNLSNTLKDSQTFMEAQEKELESMNADMMKSVQEFNNRLDELKNQENEIAKNLDDEYQETIHKFHSIIRRNSEGIVAVKNGVCTGCHMILPAQFANEVHEGKNIAFCPYCSRILFHQDSDENETEDYSSLDETGSLSDFMGDDLDDFGDEFGDEFGDDGLDSEQNDNDSDFGDDSLDDSDDSDDSDSGEL